MNNERSFEVEQDRTYEGEWYTSRVEGGSKELALQIEAD
jgi:hypothetical protein